MSTPREIVNKLNIEFPHEKIATARLDAIITLKNPDSFEEFDKELRYRMWQHLYEPLYLELSDIRAKAGNWPELDATLERLAPPR